VCKRHCEANAFRNIDGESALETSDRSVELSPQHVTEYLPLTVNDHSVSAKCIDAFIREWKCVGGISCENYAHATRQEDKRPIGLLFCIRLLWDDDRIRPPKIVHEDEDTHEGYQIY
jgi:hypothetical protein